MPDPKPEDDDDEWGFGEFTFAPSPSPIETDNNNKNDDEWGDFVESPLQSATALSQNQPSPTSTQWVKVKGALPLSLFGEDQEEEEESGGVDFSAGDDGKDSICDNKTSENLKNGSNFYSGAGINDIIASLYSQNEVTLSANGSKLNGTNSDRVAVNLDSGKNLTGLNPDLYSENHVNLSANGSKLNVNGTNSDPVAVNLDSAKDLSGLKLDLYSQNHVSLSANGSKLNVNRTNSDSVAINLDSAKNPSALNPDLYNQNETKNGNGLISNSEGLKFEFNGLNLNFNGTVPDSSGVNFDKNDYIMNLSGSSLTAGHKSIDPSRSLSNRNQNEEINFENGLISNSTENRLNSYSDVSRSSIGGSDLNFSGLNSNVAPVTLTEDLDGDDDGWEFRDAYSELKVENRNDKELPEVAKFSPDFGNGSQGQINLFAMSNGVNSKSLDTDIHFDFKPGMVPHNGFVSGSYLQSLPKDMKNGWNSEKVDYNETFGKFDPFGISNEFSSNSHDTDIEFDIKPRTGAQNGFISGSYMPNEQKDMKNGLDSHPLAENADSDETFGDFEAAVLDTGSKQEDEPEVNGLSLSQENGMKSENRNGPMPMSIFGDEEQETDTSLNIQDAFMPSPADYSGNLHSQSPSLSISDLLSSLYSQADLTLSGDSMAKPTENELDSTNRVSSSDLLGGDDNFEYGSWVFKDAVSQTGNKNEAPLHSIEDGDQRFYTQRELNTYVDFYCKLKDQLCLVSRCHLDRLKKARSTAALSGEAAKLSTLDEEIQGASKELDQENIAYKEIAEEDYPPRKICLKEFLETLRQEGFQVLDSEYELSRKLPLAEKDLKSAIELIKHATTILKILTLVSVEEQYSYVCTWSKMFSICTQELKHGASIWRQSLDKNVQNQILSKPQGKRYIIALGEIYRVVLVLEVSVKLYRPWILTSSVNSASIYALLEECHSLWSCSGLEEAVKSIPDLTGSGYYGTIEALVESIKDIHDIDALAVSNHVFGQQESICLLSGLTPELMPDMKMVVWDGKHYFLALANLWANLISSDPPKLPCIKVG